MSVIVFLNHSERNWQNPDCSFYLTVSMSRNTTVDRVVLIQGMCQIFHQDVQVQVKNGNTLVQEACDITLKFNSHKDEAKKEVIMVTRERFSTTSSEKTGGKDSKTRVPGGGRVRAGCAHSEQGCKARR